MTSASSMHEAERSKPVLWDNPEGGAEEEGERGVQDGGSLSTSPRRPLALLAFLSNLH